jgi:hypothetical protein
MTDDVKALVRLLKAKAADMALRSEKNDNNKGFYQAGAAIAYDWAAQHLEDIVIRHERNNKP